MFLKDLTEEQGIEIVKLVFPWPENIKSEINLYYQEYDVTMYEDAREMIKISLDTSTWNNGEQIMAYEPYSR